MNRHFKLLVNATEHELAGLLARFGFPFESAGIDFGVGDAWIVDAAYPERPLIVCELKMNEHDLIASIKDGRKKEQLARMQMVLDDWNGARAAGDPFSVGFLFVATTGPIYPQAQRQLFVETEAGRKPRLLPAKEMQFGAVCEKGFSLHVVMGSMLRVAARYHDIYPWVFPSGALLAETLYRLTETVAPHLFPDQSIQNFACVRRNSTLKQALSCSAVDMAQSSTPYRQGSRRSLMNTDVFTACVFMIKAPQASAMHLRAKFGSIAAFVHKAAAVRAFKRCSTKKALDAEVVAFFDGTGVKAKMGVDMLRLFGFPCTVQRKRRRSDSEGSDSEGSDCNEDAM